MKASKQSQALVANGSSRRTATQMVVKKRGKTRPKKKPAKKKKTTRKKLSNKKVANTGKGRPPFELDYDVILEYVKEGCPLSDIAHLVGVSKNMLFDRQKDDNDLLGGIIKKGKAQRRLDIRKRQNVAMGGMPYENDDGDILYTKPNPTMLIWMGKQFLKQSDNPVSDADASDEPTIFKNADGSFTTIPPGGDANTDATTLVS